MKFNKFRKKSQDGTSYVTKKRMKITKSKSHVTFPSIHLHCCQGIQIITFNKISNLCILNTLRTYKDDEVCEKDGILHHLHHLMHVHVEICLLGGTCTVIPQTLLPLFFCRKTIYQKCLKGKNSWRTLKLLNRLIK